MEIFKGGGKGVETALFEEAFHPQLNARGVQHVLALLAVNLRCRGQTVAALIFIDQGADIAVADAVHHLHQIADRPVFTEKPNLICAATLSPSVTATSRMLSPKRHTFR